MGLFIGALKLLSISVAVPELQFLTIRVRGTLIRLFTSTFKPMQSAEGAEGPWGEAKGEFATNFEGPVVGSRMLATKFEG